MTSRRVLKAAEAIREVVSTTILLELKDPRIQDVTVTYVEVSPDMRSAKVHVSVMGDDSKQRLSLHGLQSAAGFLQSKIAKRIDTRYTPRLQFVLDQGVKHSIEVSRILSELFPPEQAATDAQDDDSDAEPAEDLAEESGDHEPAPSSSSQQGSDDDISDPPGPESSSSS